MDGPGSCPIGMCCSASEPGTLKKSWPSWLYMRSMSEPAVGAIGGGTWYLRCRYPPTCIELTPDSSIVKIELLRFQFMTLRIGPPGVRLASVRVYAVGLEWRVSRTGQPTAPVVRS